MNAFVEYARRPPDEQRAIFLLVSQQSVEPELREQCANWVLDVCRIQARIRDKLDHVFDKLKDARCRPYCHSLSVHSQLDVRPAGVQTCALTGIDSHCVAVTSGPHPPFFVARGETFDFAMRFYAYSKFIQRCSLEHASISELEDELAEHELVFDSI